MVCKQTTWFENKPIPIMFKRIGCEMQNMKNVTGFLICMLMLASALFAQNYGAADIRGELQYMEDMTRTVLLVSIAIEGVIGVVFLGITAFIYFKKLRGVEKKNTAWLLAAVLLGLVGALFALGAMIGIITYLTALGN